uniref:uncharacterized protein LOC120345111 n=1 Tax=Styela clava TaxID=7725 RepID=UPI00193A24D9|nr:uncharacterized protein LOC120345111 [Styela clava]
MEKKFEEFTRKLDLMESRITKNLKIEIKAIVEESLKDLLEESINEHDKKISTQIDESVLNNTQQLTERLEVMFQQSDTLMGKVDMLVEDLNSIRMVNTTLQSDVQIVKASQEFINAEFEIQKSYLAELHTKVEELSASNNALRALVSTLQLRFDKVFEDLAQYIRRENLEFHGIPYIEGENTDDLVIKMGKLLNINVERLDISISHRLPRRDKSKIPPIIVRFTNRNKRNEFVDKKRTTSSIGNFGITGMKTLYINENLTDFRNNLLYNARMSKKTNKYERLWTTNGNIFMRKNKDSPRIQIRKLADIGNLV